jgi:type II secretory pathway component PulF
MKSIKRRLSILLGSGVTFSVTLALSNGTAGDWSLVNVLEDALEVVALGQPSGPGVTTLIPVAHIVTCVIEED